MNVALRQNMTLADYLAWEDRQEFKHEFDGFGPVAMSGGTLAHAMIQANLALALGTRLRGGPCRFFGSDLKFLTAEETVRYPDGMVICGPLDPKSKWSQSPSIVFEVLSAGATQIDRIAKAREYQATPSVQHYVMLEQDAAQAVVYIRDGEKWTHDLLTEGSTLTLPAIGAALPLAELYEGIAFDAQADGAPAA